MNFFLCIEVLHPIIQFLQEMPFVLKQNIILFQLLLDSDSSDTYAALSDVILSNMVVLQKVWANMKASRHTRNVIKKFHHHSQQVDITARENTVIHAYSQESMIHFLHHLEKNIRKCIFEHLTESRYIIIILIM